MEWYIVIKLNITSKLAVSYYKGFVKYNNIIRYIYLFKTSKTQQLNNDIPSTRPNIPKLAGNNPNLPIIVNKIKINAV